MYLAAVRAPKLEAAMRLESKLRPGYTERDGVYYFMDVREDIVPADSARDVTDQSNWSFWRQQNFRFFQDELGRVPDGVTLIDVGAGQSQFRELHTRFDAVPIDFYPYPLVRVVCDLNAEIPFADGSVDVLTLSNVLEHIAEPLKLLRECRRVLRRGGTLLGAVPFLIDVHQRPYDFYRYTDITLKRLLAEAGFAQTEVSPVVSSYNLLLVASKRFFADLIAHYRDQRLAGLSARVLWRLYHTMFFRAGKGPFSAAKGSPDAPLGYHFKGVTSGSESASSGQS
jgi:SAM-dependent methyltransferase